MRSAIEELRADPIVFAKLAIFDADVNMAEHFFDFGVGPSFAGDVVVVFDSTAAPWVVQGIGGRDPSRDSDCLRGWYVDCFYVMDVGQLEDGGRSFGEESDAG